MSDCSRRSTRNFVPSPCGAEKPPGIFSLVEEEYPQAEVCWFQPSNHGRSAGPACADPEKVQRRHAKPKTQLGTDNRDSKSVFPKPGEKSGLVLFVFPWLETVSALHLARLGSPFLKRESFAKGLCGY